MFCMKLASCRNFRCFCLNYGFCCRRRFLLNFFTVFPELIQ
ncbi:hypothetical protein HMPREF9554_02875 [Treponema phagedenis F0421]|nr:hypothetical protein HMPREF9554_02875 [Treponema phagedenis F0421]